ncbi:hypothetical protein FQR65_LT09808 [Abscondita terminalis]|nr:hypothetical protein FQR65_LT09808 [Abscondita terminalis]
MEDNRETVATTEKRAFQDPIIDWWHDPSLHILRKVDASVKNYIFRQIISGSTGKNDVNIDKPLKGLKVLDVGCGAGFLSEDLARAGCNLTGIDPKISLLEVAKNHAYSDSTLPAITYLAETVEEHCKNHEGEYDVVVANFVLQHVPDQKYFIECCSKCVKPGGTIFMSAIAKTYLAWFIQIFLLEYVLRELPRGLHHLEKFINPSVAEDFMTSCKLSN